MSTFSKDLADLMASGYFPKELPPSFVTSQLGALVERREDLIDICEKEIESRKHSQYASYSYPKGHTMRRLLAVTNPLHQLKLSKEVLSHWETISRKAQKSPISQSTPQMDQDATISPRYFGPKTLHSQLFSQQIGTGALSRFVLHADLSNFYHSVYAHSISWAVHGRVKSKEHIGKPEVAIGTAIDRAVQSTQYRETIGLPVGPDTSFVLAELVASRIDRIIDMRLRKRNLEPLRGYRHYDDYALYFNTEEEAQAALSVLRDVLAEFHLRLNESKTSIGRMPEPFRTPWTESLTGFDFGSEKKAHVRSRDLHRYFSIAFDLQAAHPSSFVLNYALARFLTQVSEEEEAEGIVGSRLDVPEECIDVFIALLSQALITRPESALRVFTILRSYHRKGVDVLSSGVLEKAVNQLVLNSPVTADHELCWALQIANYFGLKLQPRTVERISSSTNSLVAISALDYTDSHGHTESFDQGQWRKLVQQEDALFLPQWMLVYESCMSKWLGLSQNDLKGKFFKQLASENVRFFEIGVAQKSEESEASLDLALARADVQPQSYFDL